MKYEPKEIVEASELFPSLWIEQNDIKNEVGMPIEFQKRKFLIDIYNDLSPLQVWLKPPQIGATVCQTLKSFYVAKKLRRQIIYTLPTQGDIQAMVGGSINRIIAQNPVLIDWVKDHDTIEQKTVGESIIFYRGTWTAKSAMMIPSGLNIHDEVDASDLDVITQYENRLQAQEDGGWRWYFSHPSLAGHGVDVYWQQSDKKEWYITCDECKEEQILTWPNSIATTDGVSRYICTSCGATIPDSARINGQWKASSEGEFSGYHVSQLMLYNKTADDIVNSFNDPLKNKQYFYNYVLGLPYLGSEDVIPSSVVLKNCIDVVNDQTARIIIGVDTGLPIHYVCLNKDGVFYYSTCENYDQLERLLNRWPKAILVSDQGGDLIGIRQLQAKFKGRVFLCYYRKDRKTQEIINWGEKDKYGEVYVDRNNMFQLMVEQLRDYGRIPLNGTPEEWAPFAEHFDNVYREKIVVKEQKDKDDRSLYGAEYVWKRNGPDHYVHSLLYGLVGLSKYGTDLATIVSRSSSQVPIGMVVGKDNNALAIQDITQQNGVILSDW